MVVDEYFWQVEDKLKVFKEKNVDIVIDDSPEVCRQAIKNNILTLYFREKNMEKILLKNHGVTK